MPILLFLILLLGCRDGRPPVDEPPPKPKHRAFFVAPNGDNVNPCSEELPCHDILYVSNIMVGSDTLYVREGKYIENEIWLRDAIINHHTSPDSYLVIAAYRNEIPVFTNGNRPVIIEMPYVEISGLTFQNGKSINAVKGCDGAKIINNKFLGKGYTWAAINTEGNDLLVQGNEIDLDGNVVGTQGHGIYIAQGENIAVTNNRVSGMSGYGIHVFDQKRSGDIDQRVIKNVVITGNVCSNSGDRAGIIVAAQSPDAFAENIEVYKNVVYDCPGNGITVIDQVMGVSIYNNTIYNVNTDGKKANGEDGIYVGRNVGDVNILNNIIWHQADGHHIAIENATNVLGQSNLYWPGQPRLLNFIDRRPFNADPLFVDQAGRNFNLSKGSPAIDAGIDVGLPYTGTTIDLGAFEFTGR
jgi:hypothetical protein